METIVNEKPKQKILINTSASFRGANVTRTISQCPRRYAFRRSLVERSEYIGHFEQGTMMHIGLAHHYTQEGIRESGRVKVDGTVYRDADLFYGPFEAVDRYAKILIERFPNSPLDRGGSTGPQSVHEDIASRALAVRELLKMVIEDDPILAIGVPVAIEMEVRATLETGGLVHTDRIDLIYRRFTGELRAVDYKTTSRLDKLFYEIYRKDVQFVQIYRIMRELYPKSFSGIDILALKKRGKRAKPKISFEEADPYPGDLQIKRADATLLWWDKIEKDLWDVFGDKPAGFWPAANNADNCHGHWGKCPYFDICNKPLED